MGSTTRPFTELLKNLSCLLGCHYSRLWDCCQPFFQSFFALASCLGFLPWVAAVGGCRSMGRHSTGFYAGVNTFFRFFCIFLLVLDFIGVFLGGMWWVWRRWDVVSCGGLISRVRARVRVRVRVRACLPACSGCLGVAPWCAWEWWPGSGGLGCLGVAPWVAWVAWVAWERWPGSGGLGVRQGFDGVG